MLMRRRGVHSGLVVKVVFRHLEVSEICYFYRSGVEGSIYICKKYLRMSYYLYNIIHCCAGGVLFSLIYYQYEFQTRVIYTIVHLSRVYFYFFDEE